MPRRGRLLQLLPKNGVVCEIGVDDGGFANRILKIATPARLHLIDMWGSERFGEQKENSVRERFSDEIARGRVLIHKGDSLRQLETFEDRHFDWVYIDTNHQYQHTARELALCEKKVVSGGIIAGHDYCQGNIAGGVEYGVVRAVHEFCAGRDWEIVYLTLENHMHWSYALRRITTPD